MLSHGQLDFVGITQGQTTFSQEERKKTWSVPYFFWSVPYFPCPLFPLWIRAPA